VSEFEQSIDARKRALKQFQGPQADFPERKAPDDQAEPNLARTLVLGGLEEE